jgi:hypothetical protein
MAKEQWHNYFRMMLAVLVIVFAGGGYAMKINDNSNKSEKNAVKIESVEEEVHVLEVNQQRDIALREALLNTALRMEVKMDKMSVEQGLIKIDVISTKVKVDTLIKD